MRHELDEVLDTKDLFFWKVFPHLSKDVKGCTRDKKAPLVGLRIVFARHNLLSIDSTPEEVTKQDEDITTSVDVAPSEKEKVCSEKDSLGKS